MKEVERCYLLLFFPSLDSDYLKIVYCSSTTGARLGHKF